MEKCQNLNIKFLIEISMEIYQITRKLDQVDEISILKDEINQILLKVDSFKELGFKAKE